MNKHLRSAAIAASFLLIPAAQLHAQQANAPKGWSRLLRQVRPEVRTILQQQAASRHGVAVQKPNADERLIAVASAELSGSDYYDSTTYQYSGTRGSNLTNSLYSYVDFYDPLAALTPGPYQQLIPTLLYDTSRRYIQTSGTPLYQQGLQSRVYDADNRVTNARQRGFDYPATLSGQNYFDMFYNANGDLAEVNAFVDTSSALSGLYTQILRLRALYSGSQRTSDSTDGSLFSPGSVSANAYSYNGAGMLAMRTSGYDDGTGTGWYNDSRETYTYDATNRLVTATYEQWDGAQWNVSGHDSIGYTGAADIYTFYQSMSYQGVDTLGDLSVGTLTAFGAWDTVRHYDLVDGDQVLYESDKFFYNSNNHLTHQASYDADGTNDFDVRFYYEATGGNGVADMRNAVAAFATLFPNPAGDQATLYIANPQGRVSITIRNMAGQLLYQQSGPATASMALHVAGLPSGTYNVTVSMNGAAQALKLLKQ